MNPGCVSGQALGLDPSASPTAVYGALLARKTGMLALLAVLLVAVVLAGLCAGASGLSPAQVLGGLARQNDFAATVVWQLRLPRVLMAALVGAGLAAGGVASQAILRNPLASPFTLGVASGAAFGAALVIVSGSMSRWLPAASAFCFALAASFLVLGIARIKRGAAGGSSVLILGGVAIMFLFSSLTSFIQYLGTEHEVQAIVFWAFGSLSKACWPEVAVACLMILPPLPLLLRVSWDLNLLAAGDDAARSMGVDVARLRAGGLVLGALATAGAICFTGVVGFIGLVAPHLARMLVGGDHRVLLPAACCLGAALVAAADLVGRTLWQPQIIPIGIMTSFLGVPFFLHLLLRRGREDW
jgi:iron complex transport system permease protein